MFVNKMNFEYLKYLERRRGALIYKTGLLFNGHNVCIHLRHTVH